MNQDNLGDGVYQIIDIESSSLLRIAHSRNSQSNLDIEDDVSLSRKKVHKMRLSRRDWVGRLNEKGHVRPDEAAGADTLVR
jgi:hypothetical protein